MNETDLDVIALTIDLRSPPQKNKSCHGLRLNLNCTPSCLSSNYVLTPLCYDNRTEILGTEGTVRVICAKLRSWSLYSAKRKINRHQKPKERSLLRVAEPLNRRSGGSGPRLRLLAMLLTLSLVLSSFLSPTFSQKRVTKERAGAKVRLVVGIVIDQFRYDYLARFEDLFGEGGFRRLLRDGAVFTNANYSYSPTVTAPGHATFMTGSIPALDGIVEHARDLGLGGGRIDSKNIKSVIEAALNRRFRTEPWVLATVNGNVYFDYGVMERRHVDRAEAERIGRNAAFTVEGVAECFTRGQLLSRQLAPGLLSSHAANGFYAERSGDLVIINKPFYIQRTEPGTTHATPYSYDTHVPVIFYGAGVAPGRYSIACSPSDIAATLSAILKIEPASNNVGRILTEAIKSSIRR